MNEMRADYAFGSNPPCGLQHGILINCASKS